ncbi:MAG: thermonuclease family protein [Thermodesulfobacteriota bacterium]
MEKRRKLPVLIVTSVLLLLYVSYIAVQRRPVQVEENVWHYSVKKVIDGDTIAVYGGERVRYVGIDTPERGEPFYREATERNRALVLGGAGGGGGGGGRVRLVVCGEEPRDKYGRLLGWVYAGGVQVEEVLLREGLARTLTIPPCGLKKEKEYSGYQREARSRGLGIWGGKGGGPEATPPPPSR